MFEPISKNQILGSHSLEKVQTTCKSRVTLKQHKYYTTKLGRQKYLLDMELRCPILKFPQKNWTKHDVFFFCGWHLKRPSYPSWRSCAVSNLTRICFGKFLVHKKTAPTKTYTKHPTLQKYLRKNLMKKNAQSKLSNPYWFDVPNRKTRLFCPFCFHVLILLVNFHLQKPRVVFVDRSWMIDLCTEFWWRYMYWVKHRHRDSKTTTNFRCYKIFHLKLMLKDRTRNMSVETNIAL